MSRSCIWIHLLKFFSFLCYSLQSYPCPLRYRGQSMNSDFTIIIPMEDIDVTFSKFSTRKKTMDKSKRLKRILNTELSVSSLNIKTRPPLLVTTLWEKRPGMLKTLVYWSFTSIRTESNNSCWYIFSIVQLDHKRSSPPFFSFCFWFETWIFIEFSTS